eukprot:jgi/Tetstr1/429391/TSEL_019304.t3
MEGAARRGPQAAVAWNGQIRHGANAAYRLPAAHRPPAFTRAQPPPAAAAPPEPGPHAQSEEGGGGGAALETLLSDPKSFSWSSAHSPSSLVEIVALAGQGMMEDASQIWDEDLESDGSASGHDAPGAEEPALEAMSSAAELVVARRKHQQHQHQPAQPRGTSALHMEAAGYGAASVGPSPRGPPPPRAAVPAAVRAAGIRASTSMRAAEAAEPATSSRTEGYAELVDNGTRLNVYGRALEALRQPTCCNITHVSIMYLPPEDLAGAVSLLSTVPYLQRLSLEQNNIQSLPQLDVLAPLQQLGHIQLGTGNSVIGLALFRCYLLSRLPSLGSINAVKVKDSERKMATALMSGLKQLHQEMDDGVLGFARIFRQGDEAEAEGAAESASPRASALRAVSSQRLRTRRELLTSEPVDRAAARYASDLAMNCVVARNSLDLFDQHWHAVLRDLALDALDAMRS